MEDLKKIMVILVIAVCAFMLYDRYERYQVEENRKKSAKDFARSEMAPMPEFNGMSRGGVTRLFINEEMKTAMVRYRIDNGDYPSTDEGILALIIAPVGKAGSWHGPYLDYKTPYLFPYIQGLPGKIPLDPWGEPYQYRYPGTHIPEGYDLFSKGPDVKADTFDDIGNWDK